VFPYYLLEPYLFAVLWWLSRPGTALNWRAVVPLLLTIDVFIVKAAQSVPSSSLSVIASVLSSFVVGLATGLVTLDLLRTPEAAMHAPTPRLDHRRQVVRAVQDARG
jgi:hypothetical protein